MATANINFNKVIQYSKKNCKSKSISECATYVKKAFENGGCKYVSGNGWNNQSFCNTNSFKCIGDFVPVDKNPRPHGKMPIQFPPNYVQKIGDICLIKHGTYGHICYAAGPDINDWVSDYWQRPPAQQNKTGPYCYTGGYERVQFWRHESVMGEAAPIEPQPQPIEFDTEYMPEANSRRKKKNTYESNNYINPESISSVNNINDVGDGDVVLGMHLKQKRKGKRTE